VNQRLNPGAADQKTSATTIRASQLTGMDIVNSRGQDVGEVHDVVLDGETGRLRYLAVTYGGFLGIGDKLFAVPYEAFRFQVDPDDADDYVFVLDVTKQQMEGAQGFDQDNWPNFADKTFTGDLDRRYRIERRDAEGRRRGVDVRVDRNGVDVDVKRD
jgi:sporulation protein YlmC with PRC-barrel domain